MILWTPMPLELVLEGLEDMRPGECSQISHGGVSMLVEKTGDGRNKIVRLLSTDPADYLNQDYCPGRIL